MPVPFKARLTSASVNDTFLDKTIDDIKKGKLGLYKVTPGEPDAINDVQVFLNTLRTDVNSNDADISAINAKLNAGEYIIKEYADDAAYESDNGAPPYVDKTAIYYNSTSGLLRYYDDVAGDWNDVGKSSIGKHEFLGTGNGVNTDFDLSFLPLTDDSFIVYKNGVYVPSSEYSFSNPTITFNSAPVAASRIDVWILTEGTPSTIVTPSGTQQVGYYEMTATEISNKNITLPATPISATKVLVDVIGGSAQHYGIDFNVTGTTLSWDGLGLELELIVGSVIRYHYFS